MVPDGEHGSASGQCGQGLLDLRLAVRIGGGRRLVEHEDRGVGEHGASNGQPLFLTTREISVIPQDGVETLRQGVDVVKDVGGTSSLAHLIVGGVGTSQGDDVTNGPTLHVRILEDEGHQPVEVILGNVLEVDPTDAHHPGIRVAKASEHRRQGRLARPRRPDQSRDSSWTQCQVDMTQRRNDAVRGEVGGADVVEGDRHVVRNPHADLWMADLLDGQHVLQTQSRVAGLLVTPCHVAQYLDGARQDQGDE